MKIFNLNKIVVITGIAALALFIAFLLWWQLDKFSWLGFNNIIGVDNDREKPLASLTGLSCDNYSRRPIAVMMASDPIARPLSGLNQADLVVEMQVTPNGITRMMALFQCEEPEEIGSIRSARQDFITLAQSFNAIYVHWGGEREALNNLNNGIINNVDAMKYEGTGFYRKNSAPRPHNGFTTVELLTSKAEELDYVLVDSFKGYLRTKNKPERNLNNITNTIIVNYESPYDVKWTYDSDFKTYKRTRGGEVETDENTGVQVESSVIVIMRTSSKILNIDYISVNTKGEGEADFYQNGIKTSGIWKNHNNDLRFYSAKGQEMKFVPGKIWIEVITN